MPRRILVALPPVCAGVLLVSGALEHGAYGANPARGALLGIATGLAYAAFLLVQRQGAMDLRRPAGALFEMSLVAAVVVAGASGWRSASTTSRPPGRAPAG